jgi:hypothetical protein
MVEAASMLRVVATMVVDGGCRYSVAAFVTHALKVVSIALLLQSLHEPAFRIINLTLLQPDFRPGDQSIFRRLKILFI